VYDVGAIKRIARELERLSWCVTFRALNLLTVTEAMGKDCLPTHFDTPMFWSHQDLAELRGTSIVGE
jgi:hypothetical protein